MRPQARQQPGAVNVSAPRTQWEGLHQRVMQQISRMEKVQLMEGFFALTKQKVYYYKR